VNKKDLKRQIKTAHFFAGGGGGILASEILGHESVLAVEINQRRCAILEERKSEGWFKSLEVECCDIREFDNEQWKGKVDCISAGFPCQDISSAGSGTGIKGEQSGLVFDLLKSIAIIQPGIVFLENSPNIRTRGRDVVIGELMALGYSWRDGTLAAAHVGTGHLRNRWWCLAVNTSGKRCLQESKSILERAQYKSSKGVVDPKILFSQQLTHAIERGGLSRDDTEIIRDGAIYTGRFGWSPPDAGVCRVVDGLASRVDRIKTCGDGQVPLQAALAWLLLSA